MRRTPQRLLALLLLFAAGLVLAVAHAPERARADDGCTPEASWGTVNASFASQVLTLVNQHRASIGVGQLSTDSALTRSAVWKSMNMAGLGYFDHNDPPDGRTPGQRLVDCGWPANLGWGENIAYGFSTPADVMNAWLNSPGHRANIENPSYTTIGIGVAANAQGAYYWTQDFGQGSSGGSPPPTTTSPPPPTTTAPPPPATTSPPTTTSPSPPPTTTAPVSTPPPPAAPVASPPPPPTAKVSPRRVRPHSAAPRVHKARKAKRAHRAHRRVHRAHPLRGVVHAVPLGFLPLHELRHL